MNALLIIFIIITSTLFVFLISLLAFYISIRYREDIIAEEKEKLTKLSNKLKNKTCFATNTKN